MRDLAMSTCVLLCVAFASISLTSGGFLKFRHLVEKFSRGSCKQNRDGLGRPNCPPPSSAPSVKVVTVAIPGLVANLPDKLKVPGAPIIGGMVADILGMLDGDTGLNFDLSVEDEFGRETSPGQFNGAVGKLQKGEAEILAGAMEPSAAYQKVVDFTIPVINSKVQIIYTSKFGLTPATKIAVLGGTATRDLLEKSTDPEYQALWARINAYAKESLLSSYDEAVKLLNSGDNWAFIGRTPAIDNTVAESGGKILKDQKVWKTVYGSFAVRQGSPNLKKLNIAIAKLQDDKKLDGLLKQYFPTTLVSACAASGSS